MTQTLDTIPAEIPRNRWGQPLVVPPDSTRAVAYVRATTVAGTLEDRFKLSQWEQRMVAVGLSMRDDLLLSVSAHRDDRDKLNELCDEAREAAAASAGANRGTALHALTQQIDEGRDIGVIPPAHRADIEAYSEATRRLTALAVERFVVLDDLRIGGTPDRIVEDEHGERLIADVKTGSVQYGIGKIGIQLALYAHGVYYDPATHERTPLPNVSTERAIVIHLPAGSGTCELVEVDIATAWQDVQLALAVRNWRRERTFARLARRLDTGTGTEPRTVAPCSPSLSDQITTAATIDDLHRLWMLHRADWTAEHTQLAAARKALLSARVVT